MNPQTSNTSADAFKPKWRHFHPQSTVWVQNPFSHDVIYEVADEYNNSFKYILPGGKVSELPGGMIATLGVKKIVDELIQNSKTDVLSIWNQDVRAKYEDEIILRFKEAPERRGIDGGTATVNLGVKGKKAKEFTQDEEEKSEVKQEAKPEEAFPELNQEEPTGALVADPTAGLPATQVIEEN